MVGERLYFPIVCPNLANLPIHVCSLLHNLNWSEMFKHSLLNSLSCISAKCSTIWFYWPWRLTCLKNFMEIDKWDSVIYSNWIMHMGRSCIQVERKKLSIVWSKYRLCMNTQIDIADPFLLLCSIYQIQVPYI